MTIHVIALGRMKPGPFKDLYDMYHQRLNKRLVLQELEHKIKGSSEEIKRLEEEMILKALPPRAFVILLDEKGKNITSEDFAQQLETIQQDKIAFIIGGPYGVSSTIIARADRVLSFGHLTWPHMMVRILLIEQIYRAQQIHQNHPYHKV